MKLFGLEFKVGWFWIGFRTKLFVRLAGAAFGPFIFIRPKSWDNEGLWVHEIKHTRQLWNPSIWFKGHLAWEVDAFRAELNFYPESQRTSKTKVLAWYLAQDYGFDITYDEAVKLISGEQI